MLLGLYEASVMEQLKAFSAQASTLIDIGAADGYFGVGLVAAGVYTRSICFERDPVTRESLLALGRVVA
jgi:predicted RNA methylase